MSYRSKILIVGSGGQVGQALSSAQNSHQIIALSHRDLNLNDHKEVFKSVEKYNPDVLINAAAYTNVDKAEEEIDKAFAINRDAVQNLALVCSNFSIPLFHISTDYVFNGDKESSYTEEDAVCPINVYGQSKTEGEKAIRDNLDQYIILRTSWVFSATGNNFVKTMLKLGLDHNRLSIVNDQKGCPTSARSIAEVLLRLVEKYLKGHEMTWGTYHYVNKPATTWFDFAQKIFDISKSYNRSPKPLLLPISTSDYPTAAKRPKNSEMDCNKIKKSFNIKQSDWNNELKMVIKTLYT